MSGGKIKVIRAHLVERFTDPETDNGFSALLYTLEDVVEAIKDHFIISAEVVEIDNVLEQTK